MKKKLLIMLMVLSFAPSLVFCFVFPNHFAVDVGLSGRNDNSIAINAGVGLNPYFFDCLNPSIFATSNFNFYKDQSTKISLSLGVRVDLAYILKHPFKFATANVAAWTPSVSAAVVSDFRSHRLNLEASLFRLMEKDAIYEYLVPSVLVNIKTKTIESYSVSIFRFTGLF